MPLLLAEHALKGGPGSSDHRVAPHVHSVKRGIQNEVTVEPKIILFFNRHPVYLPEENVLQVVLRVGEPGLFPSDLTHLLVAGFQVFLRNFFQTSASVHGLK